jgi:hypothetical protein
MRTCQRPPRKSAKKLRTHHENQTKNIDQENQLKTTRKYQHTLRKSAKPSAKKMRENHTPRISDKKKPANTTQLVFVTKTSTKKIRQKPFAKEIAKYTKKYVK